MCRSLRNGVAGTTHLLGHVLHFRQAILDPEDRLSVMDMKRRLVAIGGDRRRVNVDKPEWRMVSQQMATAGLAELAVTIFRLVIDTDIVRSLGDRHRPGFP